MLARARQAAILAATCLASAALATPASGAPAWLSPVDLSSVGGSAEHPQVALDGQGSALAVWERSNGTNDVIQTAIRPAATGLWQAPVDLSVAGRDAGEPQVALDAVGDALVVWRRSDGTKQIVQAAVRPAASGVWQAPLDLSVAGQNAERPQVAFDAQGNAAAVWERHEGTTEVIQSAVRSAASATWGAPENVSAPAQNALDPQIAFDPQGDAIAVWELFEPKNEIVQAAVRPAASGTWQTPTDLSAVGQSAERPQVAFDPYGNAVAVWQRSNGTNRIAQGAGYDAAGPFLNALAIPTTGTAGQALTFSVSPLDVWSALAPSSWSFGDGSAASGSSVAHSFTAPGSYRVTVTGADVLGNTATASGTIAIAPAPPLGPGPPVVSGARLTHRRFRVAPKATAITARRAPRGTVIRFTLSASATLRITITRSAPGLRSGRLCTAPSPRLRRRHAKGCVRTLTVATLTRAGERSGPGRVPFSGRVGRRTLRPGPYRMLLTASNRGGRSRPVALPFVVVR